MTDLFVAFTKIFFDLQPSIGGWPDVKLPPSMNMSAVVLVDEDSNSLSIFFADTLFWSYEAVKAFVKRGLRYRHETQSLGTSPLC